MIAMGELCNTCQSLTAPRRLYICLSPSLFGHLKPLQSSLSHYWQIKFLKKVEHLPNPRKKNGIGDQMRSSKESACPIHNILLRYWRYHSRPWTHFVYLILIIQNLVNVNDPSLFKVLILVWIKFTYMIYYLKGGSNAWPPLLTA